MPLPAPSGSSAPIRRRGSGAWPCWTSPTEHCRPLDTPFTEFGSVRAEGDRVVFRAGAPDHPASIVSLDLGSGRHAVLKKATDILDRAELHLADYLTKVGDRGIPDHRRRDRVRPVLSAAQSRLCRRRRRTAAAAGQVPRRADLGGIEHAQPRHSILDQPRHRRARCELSRQHRLRPRLPRSPAAQLGRGRRRRLRSWRELSRRARAGRRQALRHQRRQRRRLYHPGGARPSATSSRAERAITA